MSVSTIGVGLSSSFSSKYENRAKKEKTDLHPFALPRQPCIQRREARFLLGIPGKHLQATSVL